MGRKKQCEAKGDAFVYTEHAEKPIWKDWTDLDDRQEEIEKVRRYLRGENGKTLVDFSDLKKVLDGLIKKAEDTNTMDDKKFRELIKRAVELHGAEKIARLIDVSRPTIKRWAEGKTKPHRVMQKFAIQELQKLL